MLATFDLPAVRQYVASLEDRRAGCNGEGTFCSDLDETLGCHVAVCKDLLAAVRGWAQAVFRARVEFDPAVEAVFRAELRRVRDAATAAAGEARPLVTECFALERLADLEWHVAHLETMLGNWVTPRRSVAPAPRTTPGAEADRQIRERLKDLVPLPADWRPTDARQARLFDGRATD